MYYFEHFVSVNYGAFSFEIAMLSSVRNTIEHERLQNCAFKIWKSN